ncbi:hypothetical protein JXA84_03770 [candidate division WOR-3 bacterium]|nr:hypothetical protein [candidate division WOR-3 bacterium]
MSRLKSILVFFLNIFKHNLKFKLIALFSAVILWFYVILQTPYNRIIEVPVQIQLPDSLVFDGDVPNSVKIEFVGTLRDFFLFGKFGQPYVYLNLQSVTSGEQNLDIYPENVIYPDWIGVKTQGKNSLQIFLQNLDSLFLPLQIEESLLIQSNWRIVEYSIKPDYTWVVGGREDLKKLRQRPLTVKPELGEDFSFSIQCTVELEIPQMPTKPFSRDSFIVVDFKLDSLVLIEKKLPVTITGSSGFYAMPDSVKLFALVSASLIDQISTDDIVLFTRPTRSDMHSSELQIEWPYYGQVETTWFEISQVKLIPK